MTSPGSLCLCLFTNEPRELWCCLWCLIPLLTLGCAGYGCIFGRTVVIGSCSWKTEERCVGVLHSSSLAPLDFKVIHARRVYIHYLVNDSCWKTIWEFVSVPSYGLLCFSTSPHNLDMLTLDEFLNELLRWVLLWQYYITVGESEHKMHFCAVTQTIRTPLKDIRDFVTSICPIGIH